MGLGEREEQLEAGLALAGFQSRQGALGDAGLRGELGQGDAPMGSEPFQAGTDLGEDGRESRRVVHRSPA